VHAGHFGATTNKHFVVPLSIIVVAELSATHISAIYRHLPQMILALSANNKINATFAF